MINKRKRNYALVLLTICSLSIIALMCTDKGKTETNLQENEQGLILNLAADAIVLRPDWGSDINKITNAPEINASLSFYYQLSEEIKKISKEQATASLCSYVDEFANTQVSSLFFGINYQRSCFDSKVMDPYWDLKDPEAQMTGWPRCHWILHQKGLDPYEILISHSRSRNISPWISIRMNDHHYLEDSTKINKLLWNHPEYKITKLFNYEKKEVRDYYKAFIQEVLEKYDVDGIELDWMRSPPIFKEGEKVQGTELINNFMKEIRVLTEQKSRERGHPVRIAARVPSASDIGKSFGLDGVAWVKDGSVDILIPTNWASTNFDIPVELWKNEIGTGYKYLLTPGADGLGMSYYHKTMFTNVETMRGFSASAYSRGADAIYLYNSFIPVYSRKVIYRDGNIYISNDNQLILKEAGKLSTSLNKPRSHVFTYNSPNNKPDIKKVSKLVQDIENEFIIHTGPKPVKGNYTIRIGLDSLTGFENANFVVKVNDKTCQQIDDMPRDPAYVYHNTKKWMVVTNVSETGARVMQFRAGLKAVKNGYNRISIVNNQKEEQEITWLEVYID